MPIPVTKLESTVRYLGIALQEIWMAETKKDAVAALEAFVETYQITNTRELPIA